jgi:hypothetical protein
VRVAFKIQIEVDYGAQSWPERVQTKMCDLINGENLKFKGRFRADKKKFSSYNCRRNIKSQICSIVQKDSFWLQQKSSKNPKPKETNLAEVQGPQDKAKWLPI